MGDAFRGAFLSHFYPDLPPIVEPLPSELPRIQITTDETDLLFRLQDGSILHLEFQTTQRPEDLLRFVGYHIAAYAQYIQPVTTIVFYGAGITRAPAALDTSQVVFKPHIVLLGNENGEKALNDLQEKVDRGEELTAEDQVLLILLPLMAQKQPLEEILPRAARLARRLPAARREITVGALLGLAYNRVDIRTIEAVLEEYRMQSVLEQYIAHRLTKGLEQGREQGREQGLEQGREQGREQGELLGKRALLALLVKTRFSELPSDVAQRIDAAGASDLDALTVRAATVERIEDL